MSLLQCILTRHVLQAGRYVPSSDVYQIGIMLHDISGGINMPSQFNDMVKQMLQKSISAEEACQMLP